MGLPKQTGESFPHQNLMLFRKALFLFMLIAAFASFDFAQNNVTPAIDSNLFSNSLGMDFITLPSGEYMMGSDDFDIDLACAATKNVKECKEIWTDNEKPKHQVNLQSGTLMMRSEVTQSQWKALMGTTIEQQRDKWGKYYVFFGKIEKKYQLRGVGPDMPMYWVSWNEVGEFVRRMNDRNDGLVYSLPSEAQWEYGCRAGTSKTLYSFGNKISQNDANTIWSNDRYLETTVKVEAYRPNRYGLFDMEGNVGEWTADMYFEKYEGRPTDGSANLSKRGEKFGANVRVLRGGAYNSSPFNSRCAKRTWNFENDGFQNTGFRLTAQKK